MFLEGLDELVVLLEHLIVFFLACFPNIFIWETDSVIKISKDVHLVVLLQRIALVRWLSSESIIKDEVDLISSLASFVLAAH